MDKIQVVPAENKVLQYNAGFGRRQIFDSPLGQIVEIHIAPGITGGWHHHGKRTMYGYVASGKLTLEYSSDQKETAVLEEGAFFQIPPGLVHRDVNPNAVEVVVMIFNLGTGPGSVEAPGPEFE